MGFIHSEILDLAEQVSSWNEFLGGGKYWNKLLRLDFLLHHEQAVCVILVG